MIKFMIKEKVLKWVFFRKGVATKDNAREKV